jgi:hypothetical protein
MAGGPGLAAVVDDPLAQQQLRQPVPRRHQVPTDILAGPHQVTGGFLLDAGHGDRDDLSQVQQAGQMPGIAQVGLDPIPARALQPRRRRDQAGDPVPGQVPGQTEPGRAGLIGDHDRAR